MQLYLGIKEWLFKKIPEFSQNPFKDSEHFWGINRVSPAEHCKLRHDSTKVKLTEEKIKDCMIKDVLLSDYMYINNNKCYTHYIWSYYNIKKEPPWVSYML